MMFMSHLPKLEDSILEQEIQFLDQQGLPKIMKDIFALLKVSEINFEDPENVRTKALFEKISHLYFPEERLKLEQGTGSVEDLTARIIDLASPIGKGQRGLIVSPPKAGKTILLQNIASSITTNYPDVHLIVLLIDEEARRGHRYD